MTEQKILYIDMDDVLCDYTGAIETFRAQQPDIEYPQSTPDFFKNLAPMDQAVESFHQLSKLMDTYILSAPSVLNPLSYTDKRIWIEEHLGLKFAKKLILAVNKGLLRGDYLIDDYNAGRGQEKFHGELIHFGNHQYPDWTSVIAYLSNK